MLLSNRHSSWSCDRHSTFNQTHSNMVSEIQITTMNQTDERLEKVERIVIPFEMFKKTLKRNYLGEPDRWGRSYVLRLYPPFEEEMEVEYYESEKGRHYDNNWNEKPFHIRPELIIFEGIEGKFKPEWPTETTERSHLTEEEIQEAGGIDAALEESREWFWNELKYDLPDSFDLGNVQGVGSYPVELEWMFEE